MNQHSLRLIVGASAVCLLGIMPCYAIPTGPPLARTFRRGSRQVSVLTQHNNNGRTGANLQETILNDGNVNVGRFGKLFERNVDGEMFSQPLYVPSVSIPGKGKHNIVYVTTDMNTVYAYDADDPAQSDPLWTVNLGPSAPWSDYYTPPMTDFNEAIGITGTPVIDPSSQIMYLVTNTKVAGQYAQQLHALDIRTGSEMLGGPVTIAATVDGTAIDAQNGKVVFNAFDELQRSSLLLDRDRVTICFAAHGDHDPYHGWIMQYDAKDLKQTAVFCTTPDGTEGGVWQSGQGPSTDSDGNIYVNTGNGTDNVQTGGTGYGETLLKLNFSQPGNPVKDWFMPYNADDLNHGDSDFGCSGDLQIPDTNLIVCGNKHAFLYVVDRNNLGHFNAAGDTQIVQTFPAGAGHVHGTPVYFKDPKNGPQIYFWCEKDHLRQFRFVNGLLETTPFAESDAVVPPGMPGGFLSVSADGDKSGTGIVWATRPLTENANWNTVDGVLHAFDASNVGHELWNSEMNHDRDNTEKFGKFAPPTIANGKVYLNTFSHHLLVYGLLPPPATAPGPAAAQ